MQRLIRCFGVSLREAYQCTAWTLIEGHILTIALHKQKGTCSSSVSCRSNISFSQKMYYRVNVPYLPYQLPNSLLDFLMMVIHQKMRVQVEYNVKLNVTRFRACRFFLPVFSPPGIPPGKKLS